MTGAASRSRSSAAFARRPVAQRPNQRVRSGHDSRRGARRPPRRPLGCCSSRPLRVRGTPPRRSAGNDAKPRLGGAPGARAAAQRGPLVVAFGEDRTHEYDGGAVGGRCPRHRLRRRISGSGRSRGPSERIWRRCSSGSRSAGRRATRRRVGPDPGGPGWPETVRTSPSGVARAEAGTGVAGSSRGCTRRRRREAPAASPGRFARGRGGPRRSPAAPPTDPGAAGPAGGRSTRRRQRW